MTGTNSFARTLVASAMAQLGDYVTPGLGANLIGVQDPTNFFRGNHNLEAVLEFIWTQGPAGHSNFKMGQDEFGRAEALSALLTDHGTNNISNIRVSSRAGADAGVTTGFGGQDLYQLQDPNGASGTTLNVATIATQWDDVGAGVESASTLISERRNGTLTPLVRFSGTMNNAFRGPLEITAANTQNYAILLNGALDQLIVKTVGNMGFGTLTAGHPLYFFEGGNSFCFALRNMNVVLGVNSNLSNAATDGFVQYPRSVTGGAPTGTPATQDSFNANHVDTFINEADQKLWMYNRTTNLGASSWFSTTLTHPLSIGATLTNNVTSGGTTNQIDTWSNLTTYSTDAAAIRNAVYQLARKLNLVEQALKLNTSMAIN